MRGNSECRIKILVGDMVKALSYGMKLGELGESAVSEIQRKVNGSAQRAYSKEEVEGYEFVGLKQNEGERDVFKDVLKDLIVLDGGLEFNDGLAPFLTAGKWGIVDSLGSIVVDAFYDSTKIFINGIIQVKYKGKWGALNRTGEQFLDFDFYHTGFKTYERIPFDIMNPLTGFRIMGYLDTSGQSIFELLNKEGNYNHITEYLSTMAVFIKNEKMGLIDLKGEVVIEPIFRFIAPVMDGIYCLNRFEYNQSNFVDSTITVLFQRGYDYVRNTHVDSAAIVHFARYSSNYNKWTIIDKYGNQLLEPTKDRIVDFSEDVIVFEKTLSGMGTYNYYGFLKEDGALRYSDLYRSGDIFVNDLAPVKINGDFYYMDKDMNLDFSRKYEYAFSFMDGFAWVKKNSRVAIINTYGEIIFGNL